MDTYAPDPAIPVEGHAPTFPPAFIPGAPIVLADDRAGHILQAAFWHGQYRYYVATGPHVVPCWFWEGFLRSPGSALFGR